MAKKRGRPKKDKFAALDKEWRDKWLQHAGDVEKVNKELRDIAVASAVLKEAQDSDPDLIRLREETKEAGMVYKEGFNGT